MTIFVIEDERHAEWIGRYASRAEAEAEFHRLAALPWDDAPNRCPCSNWQNCGREYHLVEFDTAVDPWATIADEPVLRVSATAIVWLSPREAARSR